MRMLHKIYIYREKENLPEEGWFQSCFMCYSITSGIHLFDTVTERKRIYEIYVYLCPECQKKIVCQYEYGARFKRKCTLYVNENFFTYP